jgi:hypothetical protein
VSARAAHAVQTPSIATAISYVTIGKLSELTGYTQQAIRTKIARGVWLEGQLWRKAPDGRILFCIERYKEWVESAELPFSLSSRALVRERRDDEVRS